MEYTPNANYFGTDTFEYTACDQGDGADDPSVLCTVETVTVTVTPVNDDPVANPQTVLTNGDVNVVITLTGSDIDGDSLTFTIVASPTKGVIVAGPTQQTPTSANVTYDPNDGSNASDEFEFQVDDGSGGTATAFVSINPFEGCTDDSDCLSGFVCNTSTNVCEPAPLAQIVAVDLNLELPSGGSTSIVLKAAAPASVGDLSFAITSGPSLGNITSGPTPSGASPVRSATIGYTHTGADGTEVIGFDACEVAMPANCDSGTVTIDIAAFTPPPPPVANDISVTTGVGNSVVIDLTGGAPTSEPPDGRICELDSDCATGFVCNTEEGVCEAAP